MTTPTTPPTTHAPILAHPASAPPAPQVVSVSCDAEHNFSKQPVAAITLEYGSGVRGDAHAGALVQHLSRVRRDPTQPNLRQVHLLGAEIFAVAREHGYELSPGDLGENVLTSNIDLHSLPTDTLLDLGGGAVVRLTGLRNPCRQINEFRSGLIRVVLHREDGTPESEPAPPTGTAPIAPAESPARLIRRAGVMAVVEQSGTVVPGAEISVTLPPRPHQLLAPV